jgi:hypothetical protein
MPRMHRAPTTEAFPKGVPQPAIRALVGAGYTRLEQLAGASEAELLKLHGVGPKAIRVVRQALIDAGRAPLKP